MVVCFLKSLFPAPLFLEEREKEMGELMLNDYFLHSLPVVRVRNLNDIHAIRQVLYRDATLHIGFGYSGSGELLSE